MSKNLKRRIISTFFSLSCLVFLVGRVLSSPTALADSIIECLESYLDRPRILAVEARSHPELNSNWAEMKKAHLEAVAQLIEMYPKEEIYFLARDSELLYDMAMLMTKDDPVVQSRLHLVNVSRGNMNHKELKAYLEQEGITESKLTSGKQFLFVDTGFAGTIPNKIQELFPKNFHSQLQTHLISSNNPNHPSTRVFLTMLNQEAARGDPAQFHGTMVNYEHMPRYFDRSLGFEYRDGKLHPVSTKGTSVDGSVSKEIALKYMEDLATFAAQKSSQERFNKMRGLWRELYGIASWGQRNLLISRLTELVATQDAFNEAVVRDFIEVLHRNRPHVIKNDGATVLKYELTDVKTGERQEIEFTEQELTLINQRSSSQNLNKEDLSPELQNKLELLARANTNANPSSVSEEKETLIMLDLDDTLLKEVDIKEKANAHVQSIHYRPANEIYERYLSRTQTGADSGKVIHYELHPDRSLTGYVVVNPEFSHFFEGLESAVKTGKVRILVTSSNDSARTQAMVEQLKVGGRTLKDLGVQYVDKEKFQSSGGGKNIAKLRQGLDIGDHVRIVAIDDMPDQYQGVSSQDKVVGVKQWNLNRSQAYLKNPNGFEHGDVTKSELVDLFKEHQSSSHVSLEELVIDPLRRVAIQFFGSQEPSPWQIRASYRREPPVSVSHQEVGLAEIQGNVKNQKLALMKKYPAWAKILEDPPTKIPELFKAQDFGTLGALMDVYFEEEFYGIVFKNLGKMDLSQPNVQLNGFLKAIPKIMKNHFSTSTEQFSKLFELKAPKLVLFQFMREGENLKTVLTTSEKKIRQTAVDVVFAAASSPEEFAGLRLLGSQPESEWSALIKDYLYYTGGEERLARDLSRSFASSDPGVNRFAEKVLEQVDSKKYPVKDIIGEIRKFQMETGSSFEKASRMFLESADISVEKKTVLILTQIGLEGSKFEEYLNRVPELQKGKILDEINTRTGLAPYLKIAKEKGILRFFIENTKLESISLHSFSFQKEGKTFELGSPANEIGRFPNEDQRKTTLKQSFDLMKTTVTQLQYALLMGENPSRFKDNGIEVVIDGKKILVDPSRPVEQVSYDDAKEFSKRMSALDSKFKWNLPTEAQWESAVREGSQNLKDAYYFGNSADDLWVFGRFSENSYNQTQPVAQKRPDRNGVYDMAGNVWQWVEDWYSDKPGGGIDPRGPTAGSFRVFRGGSWYNNAQYCRSAKRNNYSPS